MSRHLDNLERLFNRLHLCIGPEDELTQQVGQDVQRLKRAGSRARSPVDSTISYRKFIKNVTRDSRPRDTSLTVH